MSDLPVLYSFRRCPYAMRARMALMVSGTQVRLREIILRDKPQAMLDASPKGTVPVLIAESAVIDESLAVMRWALTQNDPEGWLEGDGDPLIETADGDFKYHLDRYKYATRFEDADPEDHREKGMTFIAALDDRLHHGSFLKGETRTLPDIAIFPFVRQFRIADMDWFDTNAPERVRHWLNTLMASEVFHAVMKKYPLWNETGEEIDFAPSI